MYFDVPQKLGFRIHWLPLQGALRGAAIGFGSAILAHYSWPLFRCMKVNLIFLYITSYASVGQEADTGLQGFFSIWM